MKKIILLTGAILMVSSVSNACGGITITGNSGATYCLSKHTMNWYSAYAWCNEQKMKLIDLAPVCGQNIGTCSELNLSSDEKTHITDNGYNIGHVWTITTKDFRHSYDVNLSSGYINNGYGHSGRITHYYALCR